MEVLIEILTVIDCILLIMVVLVQESKGGGLSSSFGSSNQILGVRQTTDFLEKATWVLAISLLAFSLLSAYFMGSSASPVSNNTGSVTAQRANEMTIPAASMPPMQGQQNAAQSMQNSAPAPAANTGKKK